MAGRAWFDHFMRRHKDRLAIRKPEGTSLARALGFNRESVTNFFNLLEAEFEKHSYLPDRIFNVDETGLSVVQTKFPHVIGMKGKKTNRGPHCSRKGEPSDCHSLHECCWKFCAPYDDFPTH